MIDTSGPLESQRRPTHAVLFDFKRLDCSLGHTCRHSSPSETARLWAARDLE